MSFRRFIQRDILPKCNDSYEVVRLLSVIISNIITFPNEIKYKNIRMLKITSINRYDKDLLIEILGFIGFQKKVENLEEFMILINNQRLPNQNDIDYIIKETQNKKINKIVDNTELVKDFLKSREDNAEKIIKQSIEDREIVNENWKRQFNKIKKAQDIKDQKKQEQINIMRQLKKYDTK